MSVNCTLKVKCPSKKKKNHTAYKRWESVVHSKTEKTTTTTTTKIVPENDQMVAY